MARQTTDRSGGTTSPKVGSKQKGRTPIMVNRSLLLGLVGALVVILLIGVSFLSQRSSNGNSNSGAISVLQAPDYHALAFSPDDPNEMFFGYHNGIKRINDGGRTWQ